MKTTLYLTKNTYNTKWKFNRNSSRSTTSANCLTKNKKMDGKLEVLETKR